MILFYAGLAILFIGLASVAWLLYMERKGSRSVEEEVRPAPKETPDQLLSRVGLIKEVALNEEKPQKKSLLSGLLNKFKKSENEEPVDIAAIDTEPRMRITKDILQTGTASVRLNSAAETTPETEPLPPTSFPVPPNFKEKHEKIETLLTEKAEALEKAEKALAIELKNKKEFNKVKDLLEKELKDDKVKYRDLQVQIGTAQMEATSYKNRVNQLELKVSKLEKTITEMEHQHKEKDEKIFDRENKLKELTDKLSTKEKLEAIKVQSVPPPEPEPVISIPEAPPEIVIAPTEAPEAAPIAAEIPAEPLPAAPEPTPMPVILEPPPAPAQTESREAGGLKLPPDILTPQEPSSVPKPTPTPKEPKSEQSNSAQ